MLRRNRHSKKTQEKNYRLHILMAFVFFLCLAAVAKLFYLQVLNFDYYQALAGSQHSAYDVLEPERGAIFLTDSSRSGGEVYPLATNKDFGNLYAVPKEVLEPEEIAEELYRVFDEARIVKEVDALLTDDEYFGALADLPEQENQEALNAFRQVKKELELKARQERIVNSYREKLSKANDPYEPLQRKVPEDKLDDIMNKGFAGIYYSQESFRYYPENNVGSHFLGFVGYNSDGQAGRYGLEGFFNRELSGVSGEIRGEKSAGSGVVIINNREYSAPQDGSDLVLTINRSLQFEVCRVLGEYSARFDADGGSVLVMDPFSGAILAMCSLPDYDPNNYNEVSDASLYNNPAIFEAYEPGSIFKAITMAAGLDKGAVKPETVYEDKGYRMIEGWDKPIKNSDYETKGGHGWVDMTVVLEESLNTGSIFVMEKIGYEDFASYVKAFGFGEKTGIELETEGLSNIINLSRNRIRPVEAATASFGQGITATPLQMATAYSAIANGGILMKPFLVDEIVYPDGKREKTQPKQIRRVISDKAAYLAAAMLVKVVDGGHAKLAAVDGYYVAGKTGTAQVADKVKGGYLEDSTMHTFVGFAPVEEPKFVMLTKLNHPRNAPYAASTVAPLFGELANFILNYYQVPKER